MIDNGAPYSEKEQVEIYSIQSLIRQNINLVELQSIKEALIYRPYRQYGVGEQASAIRHLNGSFFIDVNENDETTHPVIHVVLSCS